MNKYLKYSLIGIGAVIICLGLFFGWRFYSNVKREVKPAISVVPNDVNVLLRVNNTADFLSYLGRQHENIASLLDLNQSGLNTTILNDLKELNTQIKLGEFWMSTHIRGRQTQYLFAINVESIQQVALEKYLKKLSDNKEQIVPLFDIEETPVYGTFTSGILIVSPYKSLIDEALLQLSSDQNLLHDEALQRVLKTAGKNTPANLFIQVPELVKNLEKETKSDYAALIQAFALFSKWIEYDLIEREENTMLSGYAVQNRSQLFF